MPSACRRRPVTPTSSSPIRPVCSRPRASPSTTVGWPNRAEPPAGRWRTTSARSWQWSRTPARAESGARQQIRYAGFPAIKTPPNLPFSRWGQVFGEATIASAMIDRIVHHADVIALKGAS